VTVGGGTCHHTQDALENTIDEEKDVAS